MRGVIDKGDKGPMTAQRRSVIVGRQRKATRCGRGSRIRCQSSLFWRRSDRRFSLLDTCQYGREHAEQPHLGASDDDGLSLSETVSVCRLSWTTRVDARTGYKKRKLCRDKLLWTDRQTDPAGPR